MTIFCHISKNPCTNKIPRNCLKIQKYIQQRVSHCKFHLIYPDNKHWVSILEFWNFWVHNIHQTLWSVEIWNSNFNFLSLSGKFSLNKGTQPLKYSSDQIIFFSCRCSILLGLTFVEIKKSFTKMLLSFNFRNFRIFFFLEENRYKWTYLMF